jgi:hypothetical protein
VNYKVIHIFFVCCLFYFLELNSPEVAEELGIHGIRHVDYDSTIEKLKLFGLQADIET